MTDFLTIFGFITLATTMVGVAIIIFALYKISNEKENLERQEKLKVEKEQKEEAERIRAEELEKEEAEEAEETEEDTECCICGEYSEGYIVCENCFKRSKVLKKELPYEKINTYESLHEFRKNLMFKIIYPKTQFEKELNEVKLLTLADILKYKYKHARAFDEAYDFLIEANDESYFSNEELIIKYNLQELDLNTKQNASKPRKENLTDDEWAQKLKDYEKEQERKKETVTQENLNKEEFIDYRQKYPKNFRCADGLEVRSKSEREIANFFFENDIKYVYESSYQHPYTKETAYPDFYLPKYNLYIEYFGCADQGYIENREHKIKMYRSDRDIKFAYLTYEDDYDLTGKLKEICRKYKIPLK